MTRNRGLPSSPPRTRPAPPRNAAAAQQPPLASARWLISFLLAVCSLGLVCIYGAVCLLYWQGQWQFSFPPLAAHAASAQAPPAPPHQNLHFDATETGVLQLDGWWIPAPAGSRHSAATVLFLHDGSGPLPDNAGELQALHALGVNVFAFDYRGFGSSAALHPSEKSVGEDADAAWLYLTQTRHIAPGSIVIYGRRLGATIAAEAALRHPQCAGLVLEDAQPPLLDRIQRRGLVRFLPLRLLFHDRFDPTNALASLSVPKLFLGTGTSGTPGVESGAKPPLYYSTAAEPKTTVTLAPSSGTALYENEEYAAAIGRFLTEHPPTNQGGT